MKAKIFMTALLVMLAVKFMVGASTAPAADESRKDMKDVQLLFVQNAKDVTIKKSRLTLIGISPTTVFFSDRPKRIAGHMYTEDFVLDWQKGTSKESFHTDPPNATLSILGEDEIVDVVLKLKDPRLAGGALVYDIDVLEQEESIPSGPVSLFIDPIGMPLTPASYAGVARRTTRRTLERRAVLDRRPGPLELLVKQTCETGNPLVIAAVHRICVSERPEHHGQVKWDDKHRNSSKQDQGVL